MKTSQRWTTLVFKKSDNKEKESPHILVQYRVYDPQNNLSPSDNSHASLLIQDASARSSIRINQKGAGWFFVDNQNLKIFKET